MQVQQQDLHHQEEIYDPLGDQQDTSGKHNKKFINYIYKNDEQFTEI